MRREDGVFSERFSVLQAIDEVCSVMGPMAQTKHHNSQEVDLWWMRHARPLKFKQVLLNWSPTP